jgi:hypothetical protein
MEQTLRSGWADPVHPKPHNYSKMALNLIEKVAAASIPTGSQKRKRATHQRRVTLQELQARPREAARARTTEPRATGADPRSTLRRSPGGAIELPTPATVSTLTSLGILREAAASTRGEVRPEVVDSRSSEVTETTGEGSRVSDGGGHGAAGNPAKQAGSTPQIEPTRNS